MRQLKHSPLTARGRQLGLSLVELMVGITIGMIVVAGAGVMMVSQLTEHRRLILETQVQQDLRATADMMLRDLRRSGFWATPERGVWVPGAPNPAASATANAYTDIDLPVGNTNITYRYSRATNYNSRADLPAAIPENNVLDTNESFGFKLENNVLYFNLGSSWQPLTDISTLKITNFSVTPTVQAVSLADYCPSACPTGAANCPPSQEIRSIAISLTGQATHDANVVRNISVLSRIRNDNIVGSCD